MVRSKSNSKSNSNSNSNRSKNASQMVKKALNMGVDEVICQVIREKSQQVRFSNNEITVGKEFNLVKANIFLARGKKKAQFTLENMETMEEDLKKSVKFLEKMQDNKDYYGIAEGPFSYRERTCDHRIAEADAAGLASAAIEASDAKRVAGVLYTRYQHLDLASPYTEAVDENAFIEISVRAFEEDSSGHAVNCSSTLKDFDGEKASRQAAALAQQAASPELGRGGTYDILFTPLCFATLFSSALFSLSAFFVDSGISFFWGKMGKQVASERFSVANDGTMEEGIFSAKFDEEGVPTKRTSLIEKGVLQNFLHNTSTARKFDSETTANAGIDAPLPQNLVIEKGDKSKDDLLKDIDNGLMVTNTWYTRFQNYMAGDFSTIPRDAILVIEDGEITGSVKNIRISDNMLGVLQNIDGLGDRAQQIHWWECDFPIFSPYVRVRDVNTTMSTK